jgi:hypothetical protein
VHVGRTLCETHCDIDMSLTESRCIPGIMWSPPPAHERSFASRRADPRTPAAEYGVPGEWEMNGDHSAAATYQKRWSRGLKLALISTTGFLAGFTRPKPLRDHCQGTARFSGGTVSMSVRRDLRSRASLNDVRQVSDSVRRRRSTVSTNVRQKRGLIARRAVHDCAPLQIRLVIR